MRNENTIKINIIRHGKTLLNEKRCYIGVTDEPLSANGIEEIVSYINDDVYKKVDRVYVSPMKRAVETAKLIFPEASIFEVNEFREMDFGSFEGKNYEELKDNIYYRKWIDETRGVADEELKALYSGIDFNKSNITLPEDKKSFELRVINGLKKVIANCDGDDVTIVAHGGTIMAISSLCSDDGYYKYMAKNGEGIEATVAYTNDNGNVEISRVSFNNRICS